MFCVAWIFWWFTPLKSSPFLSISIWVSSAEMLSSKSETNMLTDVNNISFFRECCFFYTGRLFETPAELAISFDPVMYNMDILFLLVFLTQKTSTSPLHLLHLQSLQSCLTGVILRLPSLRCCRVATWLQVSSHPERLQRGRSLRELLDLAVPPKSNGQSIRKPEKELAESE